MSEQPPASANDSDEKDLTIENVTQEEIRAGLALVAEDENDPVRGPIRRKTRRIYEEIANLIDEKPEVYDELISFCEALKKHFGNDVRRYRLYHAVIGSTPTGSSSLFDTEGDWSIEKKMKLLAEKYGIIT